VGVRMGRAWQKTRRWSRQGLPADLLFRVAPPVDALDARTAGPVTPQGRTAGEPGSSADGWVVRTGEGPASGGKGGRQKKKGREKARGVAECGPPLSLFSSLPTHLIQGPDLIVSRMAKQRVRFGRHGRGGERAHTGHHWRARGARAAAKRTLKRVRSLGRDCSRACNTHTRRAQRSLLGLTLNLISLSHTRGGGRVASVRGRFHPDIRPRAFFFSVSLSLLFSSWEPQGDAGVGILKCGLRSRRVCWQGCRWARSPGRRQGAAAEQKKCLV